MPEQQDLFGKTFDQQVDIAGANISNEDISPNRMISGEIVFEPLLNGVRVTARDSKHSILWGFVASSEMTSQIHSLVAVYETLQELIGEELAKQGLSRNMGADPIQEAQLALNRLQATIDSLKDSITVKKKTSATSERAKVIAKIAKDADKMICLETSSFKGAKGKM